MFNILAPRSYSVPKILKAAEKKKEGLELMEDGSKGDLMILLTVFQDAVRRMEDKCNGMPDQPIAKRFFSNYRDQMQVYPTVEIKDTCLYKMTYKECKDHIKELKAALENVRNNIRNATHLISSLTDDLALMYHLTTTSSSSKVINAKSDVHEGKYLTIEDVVTWDYRSELLSMTHNVCMAVEFITSYPVTHATKSAHKDVSQLVFYWVAPSNGSRGVWYHDKIGVGNTKDFVEVSATDPFLQIYDSKSTYLTSQFKYYVDIKHQQNYKK